MNSVRLHHKSSQQELAGRAEGLLGEGFRLAVVAAHGDGDALCVVYLFLAGRPDRRVEIECVVGKDDPKVLSLAQLSFAAGRFEREMADLCGIRPVGHPQPAIKPCDRYPSPDSANRPSAVRVTRPSASSEPSARSRCV